jgi:hypothetical protein
MGFFRSLFDNSFESFVTVKIAKVVYTIALVLIILSALVTVAGGLTLAFDEFQSGTGIALLLFGPLFWLVILIIVRLWLENSIALIKVAENTAKRPE